MARATATARAYFLIARSIGASYRAGQAPVAQLDRALPSEGRGQRFESSRVRHSSYIALAQASVATARCRASLFRSSKHALQMPVDLVSWLWREVGFDLG